MCSLNVSVRLTIVGTAVNHFIRTVDQLKVFPIIALSYSEIIDAIVRLEVPFGVVSIAKVDTSVQNSIKQSEWIF